MTESTDDILTRPLGVPEAVPAQPTSRLGQLIAAARRPRIAAAAIAAGFAVAAGLVLALGDPDGGEPRVQVAIAMRDLELRGAGNLLGDEQSGHVAAVGFELYVSLLDDAVEELRAAGGAARAAAAAAEGCT